MAMAQVVVFRVEENLGLLSKNNKVQAQRKTDGKIQILPYPDAGMRSCPRAPCCFGFGWLTQPKGMLIALATDNISKPTHQGPHLMEALLYP